MTMDNQAIIRRENAGFTILDAIFTQETGGYCIGVNAHQYVTWWFMVRGENINDISFYHGNYFLKDDDAPIKSMAKAYADFHRRVANAFDNVAKYGW